MSHINFEQEEIAVMTELDEDEIVSVVGGILGGLLGTPEAPEAPEASGNNTNSNNDVDGENDVTPIVNVNPFSISNNTINLGLLGTGNTGTSSNIGQIFNVSNNN